MHMHISTKLAVAWDRALDFALEEWKTIIRVVNSNSIAFFINDSSRRL